MAAIIPSAILGLRGQCVKSISWQEEEQSLMVHCNRDRRLAPVARHGCRRCTVNRWLRRHVHDLPLWGKPVTLSIEYCQVKVGAAGRRVEHLPFVDTGMRYTHRFCRFVSQLCRHMPIDAVARYTGLAWRTVKAMDQRTLKAELTHLDPGALTQLRYLGVDEVARAKGHDYLTVVYNLETGELVWVTEGRTRAGLEAFYDALSEPCAAGIEAVAMDRWPAFIHATQSHLPLADIVFDRFHVMQHYSKVIDQVRRSEFKKAAKTDKALLTGSRYLLLKNTERLSEAQQARLQDLLAANASLNAVYALKEQLQQLWAGPRNKHAMASRLHQWCTLANATQRAPLRRFAGFLARHAEGICNYARHPISNGRVEARNVSIGMIRKRARGLLDTAYFKLKIRQASVPEQPGGLYALR